ncbi:MAG: hypothetical protein E6Q97_32845 [Desulfurellales bacterium]|nr:MAG: hypothetical protein E6Q97_32845 [Desulfurellales bacterium]
MVDVGTNSITQAEDALIELLANSAAFRTFVGAANATAAKARIYLYDIPSTAEDQDGYTDAEFVALFPCAIIGPPDDGEMFRGTYTANGVNYEYTVDVAFSVRFERQRSGTDTDQAAVRKLCNAIGDVIDQLMLSSGTGGHFAFTDVSPVAAPYVGEYGRDQSLGVVEGWKWLFRREVVE